MPQEKIAIIGGTGELGFGLALREMMCKPYRERVEMVEAVRMRKQESGNWV